MLLEVNGCRLFNGVQDPRIRRTTEMSQGAGTVVISPLFRLGGDSPITDERCWSLAWKRPSYLIEGDTRRFPERSCTFAWPAAAVALLAHSVNGGSTVILWRHPAEPHRR